LFIALLEVPGEVRELLAKFRIFKDQVIKLVAEFKTQNMGEAQAPKKMRMLTKFTRNLTKLAREDKLDPVIGRDTEIMRIMQILSRRTKNNPISSTGIPSNPNYGSNPNRDSIIKNTALVCPSSLTAQRGSVISVPVSALGNNYIGIYLTVKSRVRAGESAAESSSPGIRASSDPTKAGTNLFPGSQANLEVEIGSDVSGGSAQLVIEGYIQAYTGDKTAEGDLKDQFPIYLGCAVNINIPE
jgi:hypothetical protein